jgi:hypothetical protein
MVTLNVTNLLGQYINMTNQLETSSPKISTTLTDNYNIKNVPLIISMTFILSFVGSCYCCCRYYLKWKYLYILI